MKSFQYEFFYSSVPAPYFYQYKITVNSNLECEIKYILGYEESQSHVYKCDFKIKKSQLKSLKKFIKNSKILTSDIKQSNDIPCGGCSESIIIITTQKISKKSTDSIRIPSYPEKKYEEVITSLYKRINNLVPKNIKDELEQKREEYIKDKKRN
ncbi:MAG: hypothetical protein FJ216_04025 [Ignavibacteria bacterium]|nr:hypothetical protein [Ignavibacteria bacterium]